MTDSASERLRYIQNLFEEALSYPDGEQRDRFLKDLCSNDLATLTEVRRLLRHYALIETSVGRSMPVFGVYQATRIIGRGGMGVVYEANRADGEYERRVAIKVISTGLMGNFLHEELRRERQILAGLDHPGIARLLDGGVDQAGAPYQVMEFIDGVHLDRYCDGHHLSPAARLALFYEILDAVGYAHSLGVVHRDLKPSNILVDRSGHPKLLDFGAARFLRSGDATVTTRCFTPEYASPELMAGESVDQRSDIYSLGVVYAKLLGPAAKTGVARKAQARAPEQRYTSIKEFRADLQKSPWPMRIGVGALIAITIAFSVNYWLASTRIKVPAATDIWLAGQPAGTTLVGKYGRDKAPANSPVPYVVIPGHVLTFRASGSVSVDGYCFPPTPAGGCYQDETPFGAGPINGISAYLGPACALIGVFVNAQAGTAQGGTLPQPPPAIDFRESKPIPNLSPVLNQIVLIGDGSVGTAHDQAQNGRREITVPLGATHLYLAVADSVGGSSSGNVGNVSVAISDLGKPTH